MADRFLPGVPGPQVEEMYDAAPGNEIESGNFDSPESSARLVANAFGFFLNRPEDLPPLPGCQGEEWPATSLALERSVRFPRRGGRHPVLDVLVATPSSLIGIESKRFEPFRKKRVPSLSDAYWRPVWGELMKGYESVRDKLREDKGRRTSLDSAQLVKHAFALRTQVNRRGEHEGLTPVLFYLYSEPKSWSGDCTPVDEEAKARHREEIEAFAEDVAGDEVRFIHCMYRELLAEWKESKSPDIPEHAEAVLRCFSP